MSHSTAFVVVVLLGLAVSPLLAQHDRLPFTCDSEVYCRGPLLHAVQTARLFNDSKTFVDLRMVRSERDTLDSYRNFSAQRPNATRDELAAFVREHFAEGRELTNWTLPDFDPNPPLLAKIADPELRRFAKDLVAIWPSLARKVSAEVAEQPDRFSLIALPNGFIVPGGRFKEIYYWDSYWIVEGLLLSGMPQTARGVVENLMHLVKALGHVPNGSRVYYARRSQPPLLTAMAAKYVRASNDVRWLGEHVDVLADELAFWRSNRSVEVERGDRNYTLLRYYAPSEGPRPESYAEDYKYASEMDSEERRQQFYASLKSAAESGWDFSSRWFIKQDLDAADSLADVHTERIIPVDLNSIYASALETLGNLHALLRNRNEAQRRWAEAERWREAVDAVLWHDEDGTWYDYDIEARAPRRQFHPSNLSPLWQKCVDAERLAAHRPKIERYLNASEALDYPGGVPTSVVRTGEQWDMPNAWPPLQSIVVQALHFLGAEERAAELAERWVRANLAGYEKHGEMFEKYDAERPGEFGGGGEYVVQSGFGWSNGVVLEFLAQYGQTMRARER